MQKEPGGLSCEWGWGSLPLFASSLLDYIFFVGKGQHELAEFYWNFSFSEELPLLKQIFPSFLFLSDAESQ